MGPEDFALTEAFWLLIPKLLSSPCCALLRAKSSVLELQVQTKLLICHTVVICSVCVKGVGMNVAVLLGKCLIQR